MGESGGILEPTYKFLEQGLMSSGDEEFHSSDEEEYQHSGSEDYSSGQDDVDEDECDTYDDSSGVEPSEVKVEMLQEEVGTGRRYYDGSLGELEASLYDGPFEKLLKYSQSEECEVQVALSPQSSFQ